MSLDSARSAFDTLIALDRALRRDHRLDPPEREIRTLVEAIEWSEQTITDVLSARAPTDAANGAELIPAVLAARSDARELLLRTKSRRIAAVAHSIAQQRGATSVDALIRQTCAQLTSALGFCRASYSLIVPGGRVLRHVQQRHGSKELLDSTPRPLSPEESRSVDTRRPVVIGAVASSSTNRATMMPEALECIVAPVVIAGKTAALIHAAREAPWNVDATDGHILDLIVSAFAAVHERELRTAHMHRQQEAVLAAARQVVADTEVFADADIALGIGGTSTLPPDSEMPKGYALHELLTPREVQVLKLIAAGASNNQIADELVITVETVKSHVKRILRKLGAVNRSEAISLYLDDRRPARD